MASFYASDLVALLSLFSVFVNLFELFTGVVYPPPMVLVYLDWNAQCNLLWIPQRLEVVFRGSPGVSVVTLRMVCGYAGMWGRH
ncbi:uncharacterized protein EI90DRAFT_3066643 [Cantharellus anzutake]|uniref:uncharacterized protein n=1 Tax=Cantharellus anzutake TaxID=1750568 RepID=UPI0019053BA6|nr:uncharacterized protein EI90DRAFT_3066643 [Cantharellus anzutake]KAF8327709.1 hypothetical protein EI90DRAFT_3066643 [Cantharellus anzutake]